jgi:hypothetical protein
MKPSRYFVVILVAILATTLAACGGGGGGGSTSQTPPLLSPQATIQAFSAALLNNDIQKAVEYITDVSRDIYSRNIENVDNNARLILTDALKNAQEVSRTDNAIVYKATMKRPDNQIVEPTFTLRLEKGVWKISGL